MSHSQGDAIVHAHKLRRRITLVEDGDWQDGANHDTNNGPGDRPDDTTDEDDEFNAPMEELKLVESVQAILQVSISRQQSRLTSPTTPASERFAALKGRTDDVLNSHAEDELFVADPSPQIIPVTGNTHQNLGLTTQTRASERARPSHPLHRSFDGAASPIGSEQQEDQEVRERKPSLSLLPQRFKRGLRSLSHFSLSHRSAHQQSSDTTSINQSHPTEQSSGLTAGTSSLRPQSGLSNFTPDENSLASEEHNRATPLRHRADSDDELFLDRRLSTASSLGDDSRWENVNGQINVRMKAIKDTLADASFRMPSFKGLTSLNFGAPWAEVGHEDDMGGAHGNESTRQLDQNWDGNSAGRDSGQLHVGSLMAAHGGESLPGRKMSKAAAVHHPHFQRLLEDLTGDVVILGGYRGSMLRSAKPPHRQLWLPIKAGFKLTKVNLELGLDPEDDFNSEDTVIPSGMLKSIGPIDVSKRLFKRLRSSHHAKAGRLRVWDYGYDWRLSPDLLSQQLVEVLEDLPCNAPNVSEHHRGAIVIAHSLGGVITRHAVNRRPDLFGGVLYAGVPQGAVNILGPLRHGDDVGLNSNILTAQVNFTVRTSFALLPLDGKCFVDRETKEPYPVDFFNPKDWEENCFSPVIARPLPPLRQRAPSPSPSLVSHIRSSLPLGARRIKQPRSVSDRTTLTVPDHSNTSSRRNSISNPLHALQIDTTAEIQQATGAAPQMGKRNSATELAQSTEGGENGHPSTIVTIPKDAAMAYLTRTLAETKQFKLELVHQPEYEAAGAYPPFAVLYGKSLPTVDGCHVLGRDGIRRVDAYDHLTFASGDGVILAKAAQMPEGYKVAKGGVVSTDRGHISLLGDLEGVGRCLNAILAERARRNDRALEREAAGNNGQEQGYGQTLSSDGTHDYAAIGVQDGGNGEMVE